ncbi:unnamed protein product [Meganyctiphanes norvegica]|uniref:Maturase K n=1 Tax=Meganyctiphanes norvegica TaxID=48144 RepID=A0AAV2R699_MEGNR
MCPSIDLFYILFIFEKQGASKTEFIQFHQLPYFLILGYPENIPLFLTESRASPNFTFRNKGISRYPSYLEFRCTIFHIIWNVNCESTEENSLVSRQCPDYVLTHIQAPKHPQWSQYRSIPQNMASTHLAALFYEQSLLV